MRIQIQIRGGEGVGQPKVCIPPGKILGTPLAACEAGEGDITGPREREGCYLYEGQGRGVYAHVLRSRLLHRTRHPAFS